MMSEQRFPGWPEGLNNVARADQVPAGALTKALNVDLLTVGKPRRRKGYDRVYAGTNMHSAFSAFDSLIAVENGALKQWIDFTVAPDTLAASVVSDVRYVTINEEVVWGARDRMGRITRDEASGFGIFSPNGQPVLESVAAGGLYEGQYQVVVTFATADGMESGTGQAAKLFVAEGNGIKLSNIPQPVDAEVSSINIYVSQANGAKLYFRVTVPVGTSIYEYSYVQPKRLLETQFTDRLPATNLFDVYSGRMYAAEGEVLVFSEPMKYWAYHTAQNFIYEASEINMVLAGEEGIFVGTQEGVFFYSGKNPESFTRAQVTTAAIPGAYLAIDGGYVDPQLSGRTLALWWTTEGVMIVGMPDGSIESVRDTEVRIPNAEKGAMAQVVRNGTKQLVSVMKNPSTESALAFGDSVDIQVHRHGV